ncbi:MAG: hypothetical protein E6G85_07490 [Alphaproteobacteria bacterium]|nr:MAG: hypothetical protein E6G85_07490 [Alphaproteobacteria bacterium]
MAGRPGRPQPLRCDDGRRNSSDFK